MQPNVIFGLGIDSRQSRMGHHQPEMPVMPMFGGRFVRKIQNASGRTVLQTVAKKTAKIDVKYSRV